ncbi:unnamed protein product [Rhodiola kirilowii]
MATSNFLVFFLLSILISSPLLLQIHARDSQFFSKVTNTPTETQTVVLPDKQQEQQSLVNKQETEQPEFVPQDQNGYGLYGHETGLFPPATETETETETKTESGGSYGPEKYYNNDKKETFPDETFYGNNGEKLDTTASTQKDDLLNFDNAFDSSEDKNEETFYNNNAVGTQKDNVGETYYSTDRKTDKRDQDQFGSQLGQKETETYYNDNRFDNGFTNELNARYNAYRTTQNQNRGGSNVERKGMSDTRFVENGRYYYDLEKEQNKNSYNPNSKYDTDNFGSKPFQTNEVVEKEQDQNSYSPKSNYNSKYDTDDWGSKKNYDDSFYDNSGGEKYEFNTMEEYEKSRLNRYDP